MDWPCYIARLSMPLLSSITACRSNLAVWAAMVERNRRLQMRRFEAAHDHCVLPGIFMVAGIDWRLHGLAAGCRS